MYGAGPHVKISRSMKSGATSFSSGSDRKPVTPCQFVRAPSRSQTNAVRKFACVDAIRSSSRAKMMSSGVRAL